jgi:hypothetical protein
VRSPTANTRSDPKLNDINHPNDGRPSVSVRQSNSSSRGKVDGFSAVPCTVHLIPSGDGQTFESEPENPPRPRVRSANEFFSASECG